MADDRIDVMTGKPIQQGIQGEVGPDGKVRVWDLHANKWIRAYPVDAREMLKIGTVSWDAPKDAPAAAVAKQPVVKVDGNIPPEPGKGDLVPAGGQTPVTDDDINGNPAASDGDGDDAGADAVDDIVAKRTRGRK